MKTIKSIITLKVFFAFVLTDLYVTTPKIAKHTVKDFNKAIGAHTLEALPSKRLFIPIDLYPQSTFSFHNPLKL